MKIAIVGGGISGMAASVILKEDFGCNDIVIYDPNDLGGEFRKGGLKFLKSTLETKRFISCALGMDFSVKKVNGVVFDQGKFHEYPEYLKYPCAGQVSHRGQNAHKEYHTKTRGSSIAFDEKCMNDPWKQDLDLKLDVDVDVFTKKLISMTTHRHHRMRITSGNIKQLIDSYDRVIYTIPIETLADAYMMDTNYLMSSMYNQLTVLRVYLKSMASRNIWWDYSYVVGTEYDFHRVSKGADDLFNYLDFEVSDFYIGDQIKIEKQIEHFIEDEMKLQGAIVSKIKNYLVKIKGHLKDHITTDLLSAFPKEIFLLGRYAQCDSRVLFGDVIERVIANRDLFVK